MRYEWGSLYKAIPCLPRTADTATKVFHELKAAAAAATDESVPAAVVRRAAAAGNILHGFFNWDDATAADSYRIEQARDLLRGVRVVRVTVTTSGEQISSKPVPVFASVQMPDERRGYRETTVLVESTDGRTILLLEARQQLRRFRDRYAALLDLSEPFLVEIDRFLGNDKAPN